MSLEQRLSSYHERTSSEFFVHIDSFTDIKCWGRNEDGQLGLGDTDNRGDDGNEMGVNLNVVDLGTNFTVQIVATGQWHTVVISIGGTVKAWGRGMLSYPVTIRLHQGPNG